MRNFCGWLPTIVEEEVDASGHVIERSYAFDEFDTHSGMECFNVTVNEPGRETRSQIASFSDQNPAYAYNVDSMPDASFGIADRNDQDLGNFFSRPVKIASFEWGTGNILFESFNPWKLYFENPRNINRISNFSLLRAKLHMKIIINGNGFHYGRAICSYNPLHTIDQFTVDRAFFSQDIVAASQRPHFYLDPTTSQGGEMLLPFFWYKNALSIPEDEWDEMGECIVQSLQTLKHANGATDRVTISVFAWAEDVVLSMPTSTDPGTILPQSGFEPHAGVETQNKKKSSPSAKVSGSDEYGTGVVSRPASMLARVAGMLTHAPIIGPYARATELASRATAQIASLFGYSRPAVVEDIVPYKPTYMGNLANTNVPDSVQRLTMDVKQEITVDPRTTGLSDVDEMAITPLAMRESYVTQFPWTIDANTEQLLWNAEVTPAMWAENPISTPSEIHMTPSCWVGLPFKFWRGSMKFRFQIVASNYHKGRLKIVYDPYFFSSNEYNTNYTYIIDIAENKDFTVTVGWGSQYPYLFKDTPGLSSPPYSTNALGVVPKASANGLLAVYVVNELTVPNSAVNNDIAVNVFTSMCEDFEVGDPQSLQIEDYGFAPYPSTQTTTEWPLGYADVVTKADEEANEALEDAVQDAKQAYNQYENQNMNGWQQFVIAPTQNQAVDYEDLDPQSGVEETAQADAENTDFPSAPVAMESDETLGAQELDQTDASAGIFLGEHITSVRQVLKRYCLHTLFGQTQTGPRFFKVRNNNLPFYRGFVPGGIHTATSPAGGGNNPYNRSKCTTLNWYVPAFKGWRGALRWKYITSYQDESGNTDNAITKSYMSLRRLATESTPFNIQSPQLVGLDNQNFIALENLPAKNHNFDGSTVTYAEGNAVLEAEIPYYQQLRFLNAKKKNLTTETSFNTFHDFETVTRIGGNGGQHYDTYCATGEDFSLFFFTGAPIVFYYGENDPN